MLPRHHTVITVTKMATPTTPVVSFVNVYTEGRVLLLSRSPSMQMHLPVIPAVWATWRWTFGDGTFSSVKNPTHTYLMLPAIITVSLTAMNLGGNTANEPGWGM